MSLTLSYLPANQAWTFTLGDALVKVGDSHFYDSRAEAVRAAARSSIVLDRRGEAHCLTDDATYACFIKEGRGHRQYALLGPDGVTYCVAASTHPDHLAFEEVR